MHITANDHDIKLRDQNGKSIIFNGDLADDPHATIQDIVNERSLIESTKTPENKKAGCMGIEFENQIENRSDESPQRAYKSIIVKEIDKISERSRTKYDST